MEEKFKSFCAFGGGGATAAPLMDGAKLAKLCRDVKLLDKNLTSTDVDIIFSKVKAKTERKITYKQFEAALKLMAEKKYPGVEDGLEKLKAKILESEGPVTHGVTKVVKAGAVDRLTDASKFTGSHKERTTDNGKVRSVTGRKDVSDNAGTGNKASQTASGSGQISLLQSTSKEPGVKNGEPPAPDSGDQASASSTDKAVDEPGKGK